MNCVRPDRTLSGMPSVAARTVIAAMLIMSAGSGRAAGPGTGRGKDARSPRERGAALVVPSKAATRLYRAAVEAVAGTKQEGLVEDRIWGSAGQALSLAQAGLPETARERMSWSMEANGTGRLPVSAGSVSSAVEQGILSANVSWLSLIYPDVRERALEAVRLIENGSAPETWKPALSAETGPRAIEPKMKPEGPVQVGADSPWQMLREIRSAAEAARFLVKYDEAVRLENAFEECRAIVQRQARNGAIAGIHGPRTVAFHEDLAAVFPKVLINPMDILITTALADPAAARGADPGVLLLLANARMAREEQAEAVSLLESFMARPEIAVWASSRSGEARPDERLLPSLSMYITTMRNMLIREDGQNLHLLSSVPPGWLEPGSVIMADDFPTAFGNMSLMVEVRKKEIIVSFTRPTRIDPERVLVHLPDGLEITSLGRCGRSMKIRGTREVFLTGFLLNELTELKIGINRRST